MATVSIKMSNNKPLSRLIETDVKSKSIKALNKASSNLITVFKNTFDNRGKRPYNEKWDPTSRVALRNRVQWPKSREKQHAYVKRHKPLLDTGALKNSNKTFGNEIGKKTITNRVGSDKKNAKLHNEGGTTTAYNKKTGNQEMITVPARPWVYLTPVDVQDVDRAFVGVFTND